MYLALGDPLQKRNYYRAGWIKFTEDADMPMVMTELAEKKVRNASQYKILHPSFFDRLRVSSSASSTTSNRSPAAFVTLQRSPVGLTVQPRTSQLLKLLHNRLKMNTIEPGGLQPVISPHKTIPRNQTFHRSQRKTRSCVTVAWMKTLMRTLRNPGAARPSNSVLKRT